MLVYTKNQELAIKYFKKAAHKGDIESQIIVFNAYKDTEDYQQSLSYLLLSLQANQRNHKLFKFTKESLAGIFDGKLGECFKVEGIAYLVSKWPKSHVWVNSNCQCAILEFFLVVGENNKKFGNIFLPRELLLLIVTQLIAIWPDYHMNLMY